jgi:single-stranded-DNA-specific exonuclease
MDAKNKGFLIGGGGHAVAIGMSFHVDNFEKIRDVFESHADKLTEDDLMKVVKIDGIIQEDDFTMNIVEQISLLEPYGVNNASPVFQIDNQCIMGKKLLGKLQNHTKVVTSEKFECLAFNTTMGDLKKGDIIDLVGGLSVNEFMGKTTLQMVVKDWRINE